MPASLTITMSVNASLVVLLGCFLWSSFGASTEEECLIDHQKRGICKTYSSCTSASLKNGESSPVICRFQGDIAYICCELLESESRSTSGRRDSSQKNEEDALSIKDEGNDDEEMDRFSYYNRGRSHRRGWNGERATENHSKNRGGKDGYYIRGNGRGGDSNLYFTTSKQPVWSQFGEESKPFFLPNDKDIYNAAQQNSKTQGINQFNEWNKPNIQRPQFTNFGNSNGGWQENQNFHGNHDNRRTTERPRTTTSRVILPADFRPNLKPDFNRPLNFNSAGNRPQNSFYNENRPGNSFSGVSRPNYQPTGSNRPENFNSVGNRPQTPSFGGNRPDNFNSAGSRPQNPSLGGSRPDNFNYGENRPQNPSFGVNRPENFNSGGNRPQNQFSNQKRISELKCEEYVEAVSVKVLGLPLTPDPKPVTINVEKCIAAQQLIVGGENTTLGEFPHMAAIGFQNRNQRGIGWHCGGTLISEQYVLTAAHCTSSSSGKPVKVRLGEYILNKNDDGAHPEDYSIVEIIQHPDYKPPSKYNDIALLKLSRRVEIRKHIRPACLFTKNTVPEPKVIAIGWGRVARDEKPSEILLKVALNVIDKNTCKRAYYNTVKKDSLPQGIIDTQMCAGELSGGKDTCQGDSGGPIEIISKNNRCVHYIVGVTSFGKVCGVADSPGVYTKVSAYIPWIERIVWPQ